MFNKKKTNHNRTSKNTAYKKQAAFNYRSSRQGEDRNFNRSGSEGKLERNATWWLKRLPYLLSFLALIAVFLYSLVVDTHARLDLSGPEAYLRDSSEYQSSIDDRLRASIWNKFKPTLNEQKLAQEIQNEFPELQEVVVNIPFFRHRPVVEFHLAVPAAIVTSGSQSYVIDGDGRALFNLNNKNSQFDTSQLPHVVDTTTAPITLGKPVLSADQVLYIREVYLQAEAKKIKLESIELQGGGDQINVRFVGDNHYVKFSFHNQARQSVGTYFAIRERLAREGSKPVEYIDVRVPERAFVK